METFSWYIPRSTKPYAGLDFPLPPVRRTWSTASAKRCASPDKPQLLPEKNFNCNNKTKLNFCKLLFFFKKLIKSKTPDQPCVWLYVLVSSREETSPLWFDDSHTIAHVEHLHSWKLPLVLTGGCRLFPTFGEALQGLSGRTLLGDHKILTMSSAAGW